MTLKDIPDYELINHNINFLAEKYFYTPGSIRCEISRRKLSNVHCQLKEINVSLEEFKSTSMKDLCEREKVTPHRMKVYALNTHGLTKENLKELRKNRNSKRTDLSNISDEEMRKPIPYLMKVYNVTQASIKPEREKRGITILPQAPYSNAAQKIDNEELFNTTIKDLSYKYKISGDTIFRERKRRQRKDGTLKVLTMKRKLEEVSTEELFALSIKGVCEKYNVGATTVTMERRKRK